MAANNTKIAWTEKTLNVAVGCDRVGANTECEHCYAAQDACRRADKPRFPLYEGVIKRPGAKGRAFDWSGKVNIDWNKLKDISRLPSGCKVFINSMSDTFHRKIPDDFIRALFHAMAKRPDVVFQILTKRSERAVELAPSLTWTDNIWMGVTAGMKTSLNRLDDLRKIPAKIRFISAEPLLEEIDLTPWLADGTLSQVLVAGESKSGFRPMDDAWVRKIRDACILYNVPFLFKQRAGFKPEKLPELDGQVWEQYPPVAGTNVEILPPKKAWWATGEATPDPGLLPQARGDFDYDLLSEEHASELKAAAVTIRGTLRATMESMVETGAALLKIKHLLPYGFWGAWLEVEFAMSDRHARSLMAVATAFDGRMEKFSDLAILPATAISKLAVVPPEVVDEVLEKVRAGECQTLNDVATIIKETVPPKPRPAPKASVVVPMAEKTAPAPSALAPALSTEPPAALVEEINNLDKRMKDVSAKLRTMEQAADQRTPEHLAELRLEVEGILGTVVERLVSAGLLPAA